MLHLRKSLQHIHHVCHLNRRRPLSKIITIKIKSQALIEAHLEYSHDTRCRKKKNERRLTITSTPLELTNHARALTLLTNVPSPSKPPPTKNQNAENAS